MSARFSSPPILDAPLPIGTPLHGNLLAVNIQMSRDAWTLTYGGRVTSLKQRVIVQELFPPDCARVGRDVQPQGAPEPFLRARAGFLERARELRRVQHPNIAGARLGFAENNTAYLVTDRPGDHTVLERVRERGALETLEVVTWARELGGALETVHLAGLAHGGLHPNAVLLCAPENANDAARPVLADWGMERWLRQFAPSHDGEKDAFAPPEIELDARGDIYSLGALLYYALTGLMPPSPVQRSGGREPLALWEANPEVSRPVSDAVLDALRLDPNARPQSVGEFLSRLSSARTVQVVAPAPLVTPSPMVAPAPLVMPVPFVPPAPLVSPAPAAAPAPFAPPPTRGAPAAFDAHLPPEGEVAAPRPSKATLILSPPLTRPERIAPPVVTPPLLVPSAKGAMSPPWDEPDAEWLVPARRRVTGVLAGVLVCALLIGVGVLVSLPRSEPPVEQVRAMARLAATPLPTPPPTPDFSPPTPEAAPTIAPEVAPEIALVPQRPQITPTSPVPLALPTSPPEVSKVPTSAPPRRQTRPDNPQRGKTTRRKIVRRSAPAIPARDLTPPEPKVRRARAPRRLAQRPAPEPPNFVLRNSPRPPDAPSQPPRVLRVRPRRELRAFAPAREALAPRERRYQYERQSERPRRRARAFREAGLPPAPGRGVPSQEAGLPPSP